MSSSASALIILRDAFAASLRANIVEDKSAYKKACRAIDRARGGTSLADRRAAHRAACDLVRREMKPDAQSYFHGSSSLDVAGAKPPAAPIG